jgi:hypothetical protein
MEVSGQFHVLTALAPVPIGSETGWSPEQCGEKCASPCLEANPSQRECAVYIHARELKHTYTHIHTHTHNGARAYEL